MSTTGRPQLHIGDHGKDPDDEVAAVLTAALHEAGVLDHQGTTADVAMGSGCGSDKQPKPYELTASYMPAEQAIRATGSDLFCNLITRHAETGIDLVLMSGLTDAAALLRAHREAFRRNVNTVTLMSGVEARRNGQQRLVPDHTANNDFDYGSAKWLYEQMQQLRIPLTIVTRNAAKAAAFPASFYEDLADTGHPVGIRLATIQAQAIQSLWEQCHVARERPWGPANNPRTPQWFRNTFCNGGGQELTSDDSIWPAVTHLAQYDSLAVIASVPSLRDRFFQPTKIRERGTVHRIIGATAEDHGVRNAADLREFILIQIKTLLGQTAANAVGTAQTNRDRRSTP
jgi:hypothetical protein